jgi:5'-deoxynucleotidase YfbR-like HD superfamily hydrolase
VSDAVNEIMFGKLSRLTDTFRYSAQSVIIRENVAEHSFWTAMIGIGIALEAQLEPFVPHVALKAVVHDIEECMTGDLVRDMKYASPDVRDAIKEIERRFLSQWAHQLGEPGAYLKNQWRDAKDKSKAGQIVACADALSVIAYCTREMSLGNQNLHEIRNSCVKLIHDKFGDDPQLVDIADDAIQESYRRWPSA